MTINLYQKYLLSGSKFDQELSEYHVYSTSRSVSVQVVWMKNPELFGKLYVVKHNCVT